MTDTILIQNGRVVDPKNNIDEITNVIVAQGVITACGSAIVAPDDAEIIDAKGCIIAPGFLDLHVHLREPGREDAETIASGCSAAAAGGFTGVACMPNTTPAIDTKEIVRFVLEQAAEQACAVYPVAAITKGRKGVELTEMAELADAGAVAVSDDGDWVADGNLMRRALEYAHMYGLPVISHCEERKYALQGVMHEGATSTRLGMKGIPRVSEDTAVSRDIALAEYTGAHLHIAHMSTAGAVDEVRRAKARGVHVTAETAPHYICFTDTEIAAFNTSFKMKPPLRTEDDVAALKEGLRDGTIDCIATDHAPHASEDKDVEFDRAPFGIIGLETALSVCLAALVDTKVLSLNRLIELFSYGPAGIIGIKKHGVVVGAPADITIFDPQEKWTVTAKTLLSLSKNSPWLGKDLRGKAVATIIGVV